MAFTPEEEIALKALVAQPSQIISDLEAEPSLSGDEVIPVEDGSGTFAISLNDVRDFTLDAESANEGDVLTKVGGDEVWQAPTSGAVENLIINGDFRIAQRGSSFTSATAPANSDNTYLLDRWRLLSDGNDIVDISQDKTVVPTGAFSSIKIDQETANKQWAIFQPILAADSAKIIGGVASMAFEARKGGSNATLGKLRAAIISWDSTVDATTADPIATWAGGGTNPTLAAGWTYENTPSDLTTTTSFQEFKIENVAIDTASAKNCGVLIWVDDTNGTVADLIYISKVRLSQGSKAPSHNPRISEAEFEICKSFFERIGGTATNTSLGVGMCTSTTTTIFNLPFKKKIKAPNLSVSNVAHFRANTSGANITTTNVTYAEVTEFSAAITFTVASGLTADRANFCDTQSSGYINIDSEI